MPNQQPVWESGGADTDSAVGSIGNNARHSAGTQWQAARASDWTERGRGGGVLTTRVGMQMVLLFFSRLPPRSTAPQVSVHQGLTPGSFCSEGGMEAGGSFEE